MGEAPYSTVELVPWGTLWVTGTGFAQWWPAFLACVLSDPTINPRLGEVLTRTDTTPAQYARQFAGAACAGMDHVGNGNYVDAINRLTHTANVPPIIVDRLWTHLAYIPYHAYECAHRASPRPGLGGKYWQFMQLHARLLTNALAATRRKTPEACRDEVMAVLCTVRTLPDGALTAWREAFQGPIIDASLSQAEAALAELLPASFAQLFAVTEES